MTWDKTPSGSRLYVDLPTVQEVGESKDIHWLAWLIHETKHPEFRQVVQYRLSELSAQNATEASR